MTGATINFYKEYYALPELKHEEDVTFDFFKCLKHQHDFVILVIFNERKEVLLIRDFNKNIGWELPGGYVRPGEMMEDTVSRISLQETGLEVDEVCPVSFVKNIFKFDGREIVHTGIAFFAMSRSGVHSKPENMQSMYTAETPKKMAYQNSQVLNVARQRVADGFLLPPYNEIESAKKYHLLYLIHEHFVKKVSAFSSRKIFKQLLKLVVGEPKSILDASCGDCQLIFQLQKIFKPVVAVANDISRKTISLIKSTSKSVIFTNHNVLNFPFKNEFDLIVFKNTLHHIAENQHLPLLRLLISKSKQLIVVDIDDPVHGDLSARLWNKYYRVVLGDQGNDFLTFSKFKNTLKLAVPEGKKCKMGRVQTFKGQYFYASIYS